jgi:hypothetical protein
VDYFPRLKTAVRLAGKSCRGNQNQHGPFPGGDIASKHIIGTVVLSYEFYTNIYSRIPLVSKCCNKAVKRRFHRRSGELVPAD